MPIRYDRAAIKATKTPEGFVRDTPILSRVGVFEYRQPDGTIRKEFRPPEEVFSAEHLDSLFGQPITDDHHGLITSETAAGKTIGAALSKGRQDADNMVGDIVIHDARNVGAKKDLSLGYTLDIDPTPGEYKGIRYDAVQRNLRVNHIALVARGRAGNARLNLDAADAVLETPEEAPEMPKLRLDSGLEYDAAPEVIHAYTAAQTALAAANARADSEKARADGLDAKVAKHDADLIKAREDARAQVAGRLKLEADATAVGAKFAQDATDDVIRAAVIKAVRGDAFDLTGKSPAYLEVAFDMAVADGKTAAAAAAGNRAAITPPARQDGEPAEGSAAAAREKYVAGLNNPTKQEK